ncbi:MAG: DUF3303 family protein [Acidobacteria bacterium]|nr:DUF3303 family protein [Acidobacteriota bacterium]MBK8146990.1 DUF3303 family protein [Acidobacteriota bacterium]
MLYMVIEKFLDAPAIYRRFEEKGRMMPDGLNYVSSWIDRDLKTCFQLMETEDFALFEDWTKSWADIMECEIVPVVTSAEAARLVANKDD